MDSVWTAGPESDRLSTFLARLRRRWWLVGSAVLISIAISIVLAFTLQQYWRVEIVLMPVTKSGFGSVAGGDLGGLSGLLGGVGGISSLLGRPSSNQDEAIAVLESRELFDTYAAQENLLPILFSEKWDSEAKHWKVQGAKVPTLRAGYKLFSRKVRDVTLDRRTGIVTLGITWKDRAQAVKWANDLVVLTNAQVRARAINTATQNMRFLTKMMSEPQNEINSNALHAALANAYEYALQNYMFATGQADFAFHVIDPPTIPDDHERVFPQRPLFAMMGLVIGCILALGVVQLGGSRKARVTP